MSADLLDRVKVPVGLDLGHTSHREISAAILAELVAFRASGALAGDCRPPRSTEADRRAIDPVCGMTVTPGPSTPSLTHDGVTYYFCCVGCRTSFERDPDSYLQEAAHAD